MFREIGCFCGGVKWELVFVERIMNVRFGRVYSLPSHLQVVVINQVTTKFKAPEEAYLTPALGESWAHAVPRPKPQPATFLVNWLCRVPRGWDGGW